MPLARRHVADSLADDAHALLAGADPLSVIACLEFRIQDLQEISDNESHADNKKEKDHSSKTVDP